MSDITYWVPIYAILHYNPVLLPSRKVLVFDLGPQVLVLVLWPQVLVLVLERQVLVLVLEPKSLSSSHKSLNTTLLSGTDSWHQWQAELSVDTSEWQCWQLTLATDVWQYKLNHKLHSRCGLSGQTRQKDRRTNKSNAKRKECSKYDKSKWNNKTLTKL